ncbi:Hsp70 family protein [Mycobacterium sp. 1164985.4]|uniref:Hsp70 family protein n=1 Tax=Mycobacterium sp. 1164985.4 TaxID=1834069 RepID=UPI0007FFBAB9|nr:Hsp70 family protein [Mycobacterium sp. 1164985.4]OBK73367.1 molecular chaperone [Mycobacterium sp. 1164985.4]
MADGVGLSVGATNLAAVVVGRAALTRSPVLTLFPHRPPEVGVPSENRNLNERGLILTDFVDRVGDPVGIVAADGTSHKAEVVLADALRAMLHAVGGGRSPVGQIAVTHPAHWRPASVDALRGALAAIPEFQRPQPAPVVSDAVAALTSLKNEPGVPARGVIALCDFGGTGTSVSLFDADNGYAQIGETVRHHDLSGDLVDQALLTHVIEDLSAAGAVDLSSTSAIGSLSRLRSQCRGAKERLSTAAFTSLVAELPGHRSDVRLTRTELDEALRGPLAGFTDVLQDTLQRNGVRELAAVASVGGGARIPVITTTLSERFRAPVITSAHPELSAAEGGGLAAVRGTVEEGMTAMSAAPGAAAAAAAATAMAPELGAQGDEAPPQSGSFGALAWSDADDVPDVPEAMATDPYDYSSPAAADVRPQMQFEEESWDDVPQRPVPWYRNPAVPLAGGVLVVLAALVAAVVWVMSGDESAPAPASTTTPPTVTPPPTTTTTAEPPPPATQAPQTVYQPPPPATRTVTEAPQSPEPPPPSPEPPPPTSEPPPPTSEPPPAATEPPPTTQPPPWSPTAPYPTIPGLPWVPAPQLPGQPAP